MSIIIEGVIYVDVDEALAAYKPLYGPEPVEGKNVLVIIVSTDEVLQNHIDAYEMLLRATYGENNVKVQGCGEERIYRGYSAGPQEARQPVKDLWFATRDFLSVEEFATLLNIYAFAGESYDQIHVVGHGDPDKGLLFRTGVRIPTGASVKGPFDEAKAGDISENFQWPIKSGAKVVLVGCDAHKSGMKAYIERIVGPGNVHGVAGDFKCAPTTLTFKFEAGGKVVRKSFEVATDWYNPKQHGCIARIGDALGIAEARGIRPARGFSRIEEFK